MKQVWRLEAADGTGVYRHVDGEIIEGYMKSQQHPMPGDDTLLSVNLRKDYEEVYRAYGQVIFGFDSPRQLLRWFYDEEDLREFGAQGIFVTVYESDKVYMGHSQVCFPQWEHATNNPVRRMTPDEFLAEFGSEKPTE
jgi:hypothetical protein